MKSLTKFLNESINESNVDRNEVRKFETLIASPGTERKIMKDSGLDQDVVSYALSYIEATIESMIDEHGDKWKKYMAEWIDGDFIDSFIEYMTDEMNLDREDDPFVNADHTKLVKALLKHLGLK